MKKYLLSLLFIISFLCFSSFSTDDTKKANLVPRKIETIVNNDSLSVNVAFKPIELKNMNKDLAQILGEYLNRADIANQEKAPLFKNLIQATQNINDQYLRECSDIEKLEKATIVKIKIDRWCTTPSIMFALFCLIWYFKKGTKNKSPGVPLLDTMLFAGVMMTIILTFLLLVLPQLLNLWFNPNYEVLKTLLSS
jgi:hypothetical protein